MANRSVQASRFAMVPRSDVARSAFDVSFSHKTTFDAGILVPVYVDEVLPGDSFRVRMTAFARLATPLVPIMDNLVLESFFFFMPSRLLWDRWERFMGEQESPTDSTEFLIPQAQVAGALVEVGQGTLADYFGITDNNSGNTISVNALPFRMYVHVWNHWFRDQNLQAKIVVATGDGPDVTTTYSLLRRGKRHDYFTSCLPWPQKPTAAVGSGFTGDPFVPGGRMSFPAAGAPVTGLGVVAAAAPFGPATVLNSGVRTMAFADSYSTSTSALVSRREGTTGFPDVRVLINDIRTANMVQLMLERNARGGTRYAEIVRSHFGVTSPDARLQRPEYLGGGRTFVNINPVAQTSATGATGTTTVLGELAGIGTAVSNNGFTSSFTEHGYLMGLVSMRADLNYQQGVERMWHRRTLYDFYWPGLANLGEQAVLTREIYMDGSANDLTVFGYQERWAEYRHKPSRISGAFRTIGTATPLDMWHLAQHFVFAPVLNSTFIEDNPPMARVLQTETTASNSVLLDALFDLRMVRPLPMFSIPGLGPRL